MSNKNNSGGLEALLKIAIAPPLTPFAGSFRETLAYEAGRAGGIRFATRWTGAGIVTGFMGGILLYWLSMGPLPTPPPPLGIPDEIPNNWRDQSQTFAQQTGPATDPAIWHIRTDIDPEMPNFGALAWTTHRPRSTLSGLDGPPLTIRSISKVLEDGQ